MALGRDGLPFRYFEDPFRGIPKCTDRMDITPTWGLTALGPVPLGHVYRVVDIDVSGADSVAHFVYLRTRKEHGVGGFSYLGFRTVNSAAGVRMPSGTTGSELTQSWTLTLEYDDIIQMQTLVAATIAAPQVQISYWDIRQ